MTDTVLRGVVEAVNQRLLARLREGAEIHTVRVEADGSGGYLVMIGYSYKDNGYGFTLEELHAVVTGGEEQDLVQVKVVAL